jgi:hypothetical protein
MIGLAVSVVGSGLGRPTAAIMNHGDGWEPHQAGTYSSHGIASGRMDYLQQLSSQARARIEAERLRAGMDLQRYRAEPETRPRRPHTSGAYGRRWSDAEEDLHDYLVQDWPASLLRKPAKSRTV